MPSIGGYTYEEEMDELSDGTKISRLVKINNMPEYEDLDSEDEDLEIQEVKLQAKIDDATCISE